jgi:urea transporter
MKTSWKTTVAGILTAVGMYLQNNESGTLKVIGQVLTFAGSILLGFMAKDYNVSGK